MVRVVSAKLSTELIDAVDIAAAARGLSRNGFVRECLEAGIDDRVAWLTDAERTSRRIRAGLARDREALGRLRGQ